jgi:lysophospholipase L1-like esterase
LSIPDWGLTPFNKDRDKQRVSTEIDQYNKINRDLAENLGTRYLDITQSTRLHATDSAFLATDLLHYSANEYEVWAKQVAKCFNV